jgi:segregation and condensation protein A
VAFVLCVNKPYNIKKTTTWRLLLNDGAQLNLPGSSVDTSAEDFVVKLHGKVISEFPKELYIPPDALKIFLEAFEGPLDLLLYLIRKQDIDILDLPIESITRQYLEYITLMQELHLELAAEYLLMAATLAEIKSRLLLPRPVFSEEAVEEDPRTQLVKRLQEYERFKQAAETLGDLPRLERDIFLTDIDLTNIEMQRPQPSITLEQLHFALQDVFERVNLTKNHAIAKEMLSVRERMSLLLNHLTEKKFSKFTDLLAKDEGKMGVVVTFIAMMELSRQSIIQFVQSKPFADIYLQKIAPNQGGL